MSHFAARGKGETKLSSHSLGFLSERRLDHPAQATDPGYWTRQLREPVRFADAVQKLFMDPRRILLEVGPGTTLSTFAKQHPGKSADHIELASLQQHRDAVGEMLQSLGRLWIGGVEVAWARVHGGGRRQRLHLPTYPFERKRFWIEPPATIPNNQTLQSSAATRLAERDRRFRYGGSLHEVGDHLRPRG